MRRVSAGAMHAMLDEAEQQTNPGGRGGVKGWVWKENIEERVGGCSGVGVEIVVEQLQRRGEADKIHLPQQCQHGRSQAGAGRGAGVIRGHAAQAGVEAGLGSLQPGRQ